MALTVKPNPMLRSRRMIKLGNIAAPEVKIRSLDAVAMRHITNHPEYKLILACLREGAAVTEIANHFAREQLLSVSEKTFQMYLYIFRAQRKALIEHWGDEDHNIDRHVRGDQPTLDADREIDRAIRFQKLRVGLGYNQEKNLGLPMEIVNKDVRVLGQLLELKARQNSMGKVGRPVAGAGQTLEKTVEDKLKEVQRDEEGHQNLFRAASDLVESVTQRGGD